MLQRFRIMLRSLCSNVESALAKQMCALLSIAWVRSQNCLLRFWQLSPIQCAGARALHATSLPIRLTHLDKPRQPKSSSIASASPLTAARLTSLHRGLEQRLRGLLLPARGPKYQPKYGVFGHLSSYPHRSRAAPFFCSLDSLTIQDSRAWLRMTASSPAHLSAQLVVNTLPASHPTASCENRCRRSSREEDHAARNAIGNQCARHRRWP